MIFFIDLNVLLHTSILEYFFFLRQFEFFIEYYVKKIFDLKEEENTNDLIISGIPKPFSYFFTTNNVPGKFNFLYS